MSTTTTLKPNSDREALLKIKAIVEREPCSIIGAYNLRAGVKKVLSEAGL